MQKDELQTKPKIQRTTNKDSFCYFITFISKNKVKKNHVC